MPIATKGCLPPDQKPNSSALFKLILSTSLFVEYISPILTGISVPHISPNQIASFRFGLPGFREQGQIVEHTTKHLNQITELETRASQQIDRMKEYRTALIAEAVTGQLNI